MPQNAGGHLGVLREGSCTEKASSPQEGQAATRGHLGYATVAEDKEGGLPDARVCLLRQGDGGDWR